MDNDTFEILESVCANTPEGAHYMLLQARDAETGETVWAVGDEQVCALTRADFIRNRKIEYNNVLIQEFPYKEHSPESVGRWRPLIEELVKHTMRAYLDHEGRVHVYPQWIPSDLEQPIPRDILLEDIDHIIFHEAGYLEAVPKARVSDGK